VKALQEIHSKYVEKGTRVYSKSYAAFTYYMACAEAIELLMIDKGVA
jgi:hypothetical protein